MTTIAPVTAVNIIAMAPGSGVASTPPGGFRRDAILAADQYISGHKVASLWAQPSQLVGSSSGYKTADEAVKALDPLTKGYDKFAAAVIQQGNVFYGMELTGDRQGDSCPFSTEDVKSGVPSDYDYIQSLTPRLKVIVDGADRTIPRTAVITKQ